MSNPPTVACVIGWPVKHSRSPLIHNGWLKQFHLPGQYDAIAVPPTELEAFMQKLRSGGAGGAMKGCNVTVPHKEEVLKLVDVRDALAQKTGAVNTVIVRDGKLEGRNTDVYGFTANLETAGKAWRKRKPALILGAGGAARAVIVALHEAGCQNIKIANRTLDRARDLIADMKSRDSKMPLELVAWEDREDMLEHVELLVNTTTQGMEGQNPLEIDLRQLREGSLVTDLVYTPLITPLLAEARRRGHTIVDGLGMLLHQAVPGFEAWFGVRPTVDAALRSHILHSLNPIQSDLL